jgi:hypothetical protein
LPQSVAVRLGRRFAETDETHFVSIRVFAEYIKDGRHGDERRFFLRIPVYACGHGLPLNPSQSLPLSFDLGVQGYTGKRQGVAGSLQVKWEF